MKAKKERNKESLEWSGKGLYSNKEGKLSMNLLLLSSEVDADSLHSLLSSKTTEAGSFAWR